MGTLRKIDAILLNIKTNRPKLVNMCRYEPTRCWQNFTEIYLTWVKISQKVLGGYFFDSHCTIMNNGTLCMFFFVYLLWVSFLKLIIHRMKLYVSILGTINRSTAWGRSRFKGYVFHRHQTSASVSWETFQFELWNIRQIPASDWEWRRIVNDNDNTDLFDCNYTVRLLYKDCH